MRIFQRTLWNKIIHKPKLQEKQCKGSQWCKINTDLFYFLNLALSFKKGITNKTVNKEYQPQHFENIKNDPLENSVNILFDNSNDPDLHFYNTNIQHLTYCLDNFKIL